MVMAVPTMMMVVMPMVVMVAMMMMAMVTVVPRSRVSRRGSAKDQPGAHKCGQN